MNVKEKIESFENLTLIKEASFSSESLGREIKEPDEEMRTCYMVDRDRIIQSKSFRRLKHKTQVYIKTSGDHYRTRLTHTLEVAQIGRTIARALRLNEDLTEAMALGHDLGHTPYGHAGERVLNELCPEGFRHYEQSIRVVEFLEKDGQGLNLTWEVRDGILNHRTAGQPSTMEGKVIRLADKIAYINHDIDDAIRGGILCEENLPEEYTDVLGHTTKERLNTLIHDIINESMGRDDIRMSEDVHFAMTNLRKFMFESVYTNPKAKSEEKKVTKMLTEMYKYFLDNYDEIPEEFRSIEEAHNESRERAVCDYIAGMSDLFAVNTFKKIFIPASWKN